MIAIETYYIGPTDTKPSRIVAKTHTGHRMQWAWSEVEKPSDILEDTHRRAAEMFCDKMDWRGELVGGGTKRGYVWVFTD